MVVHIRVYFCLSSFLVSTQVGTKSTQYKLHTIVPPIEPYTRDALKYSFRKTTRINFFLLTKGRQEPWAWPFLPQYQLIVWLCFFLTARHVVIVKQPSKTNPFVSWTGQATNKCFSQFSSGFRGLLVGGNFLLVDLLFAKCPKHEKCLEFNALQDPNGCR